MVVSSGLTVSQVTFFFVFKLAGRRQDGDGRGVAHGGHGAVFRGAFVGHEEVVD